MFIEKRMSCFNFSTSFLLILSQISISSGQNSPSLEVTVTESRTLELKVCCFLTDEWTYFL